MITNFKSTMSVVYVRCVPSDGKVKWKLRRFWCWFTYYSHTYCKSTDKPYFLAVMIHYNYSYYNSYKAVLWFVYSCISPYVIYHYCLHKLHENNFMYEITYLYYDRTKWTMMYCCLATTNIFTTSLWRHKYPWNTPEVAPAPTLVPLQEARMILFTIVPLLSDK